MIGKKVPRANMTFHWKWPCYYHDILYLLIKIFILKCYHLLLTNSTKIKYLQIQQNYVIC